MKKRSDNVTNIEVIQFLNRMQNKMDESVLSDMYETNGFKLFNVQIFLIYLGKMYLRAYEK